MVWVGIPPDPEGREVVPLLLGRGIGVVDDLEIDADADAMPVPVPCVVGVVPLVME